MNNSIFFFPGKMFRTRMMICIYLFAMIVVMLKPEIITAQIFTKQQSSEACVPHGRTFGAGWIDYNSDGYPDILANNYDSVDNIYINDKNGGFYLCTDALAKSIGTYFSGITWGDFDNNDYNDLLITTLQGNNSLYMNNGNADFDKATNSPVVVVPDIHLHATLADYDNDGWVDLYLPTCSSFNFTAGGGTKNYLFRNNGDGTLSQVSTGELTSAPGNNQCGNFSDYDNDGDMDLFVTEWEKDNWLFENNGDGTFTKITGSAVNPNSNSSMSCAWGDYDNDGYIDLYVGNGSGDVARKQKNFLFHNNGDKTFTKITTGDAVTNEGCTWTCYFADFDNDGDLDLFSGELNDPNIIYLNDGAGNFTKANAFDIPSSGTSGGGYADYDKDGFLDLYTTEANNLGNSLYHNNGNSNKWISIECQGTVSNGSAVGAKVKVKATIFGKSYWQKREINGNQGFRSFCQLQAHFGLGDAAIIDSLIIEWSSKQTTIMENVDVNQFLKIVEPVTTGFLRPLFNTDVTSGYSPLSVAFSDNSKFDENNPVVSWSWDLNGDGVEDSNEKNPVFVYDSYEEKNFDVTLTVSNGTQSKSLTRKGLINVIPLSEQNIALAQTVTASSSNDNTNVPERVVDGNRNTFWLSNTDESQWIQIGLNDIYPVGKIIVRWSNNYARNYNLQYSADGNTWSDIVSVEDGNGSTDENTFTPVEAKVIKINMSVSSKQKGYAIGEVEVYRPNLSGVEDGNVIPAGFQLSQNYPNPFNPVTTINYIVPEESFVTLRVYDLLGQEIKTLVKENLPAGSYSCEFDGTNLSSGIYIYKLTSGNFYDSKKMLITK